MTETPGEARAEQSAEASGTEFLARIWARVKEHKVIQWGLAYLGTALALAHGTELVSQALDWPHIVPRVVVVLLALGLPIVVTLSWYHGHKGARQVSGAEAAIISLLMVICAVLLVVFVRPAEEHAPAPVAQTEKAQAAAEETLSIVPGGAPAPLAIAGKPRIAILPFDNLSPDPANAFFTDGLHEEILSTLASRTRDLEVISRTTMMLYRAQPKPISEIAKELSVTHVLEGSVRREGDEVRLTLQLIDARNDDHLWSQNYDRKLVKAMTLQTEVAGEVAAQLSVELLGGAQAKAPTTNPEAYDLYLKARLARQDLAGPSPPDAWRRVVAMFGEAIARDPGFLLAYVGRIDVSMWLFGVYQDTAAPVEQMRADLAAVRKIAPGDPGALAAAALWAFADQDFAGALQLFDAAEQAGFADPNVLIWKSTLLSTLGRHEESLSNLRRLVALDQGNQSLTLAYVTTLGGRQLTKEALAVIDLGAARWPESDIWPLLRTGIVSDVTGDDELFFSYCSRISAEQFSDTTNLEIALQCQPGLAAAKRLVDAADVPREVLVRAPGGLPAIGIGMTPVALIRGRIAFRAGATKEAVAHGREVLEFVAKQPVTKWNAWYLRMLEAHGHFLIGDKAQAVQEAREALGLVAPPEDWAARVMAQDEAAKIFAWAGEADEAMDLVEALDRERVFPPAYFARRAALAVPLADNARYQALKAKLEAQMAAAKLE